MEIYYFNIRKYENKWFEKVLWRRKDKSLTSFDIQIQQNEDIENEEKRYGNGFVIYWFIGIRTKLSCIINYFLSKPLPSVHPQRLLLDSSNLFRGGLIKYLTAFSIWLKAVEYCDWILCISFKENLIQISHNRINPDNLHSTKRHDSIMFMH